MPDDHIWAETYSGTVGDVLNIQENVSRAIVEALRLRLTEQEQRRLARRPAPDFPTFDCYMRARTAINEFTLEGVERAIVTLEKGIEAAGSSSADVLSGLQTLSLAYRAREHGRSGRRRLRSCAATGRAAAR